MNSKLPLIERAAFALVFLTALGLRTLNLGSLHLTNLEAAHALEALAIARGDAAVSAADPLYTLLTSLVFFLVGDSNALARLLPALAGASLALIPFVLRKNLGALPALVLAAGLALDPVLVANARLATGQVLALAFAAWAWTCWRKGSPVIAGILAGLALLGVRQLLFGLMGLGLAVLIWCILFPQEKASLRSTLVGSDVELPAGSAQKAALAAGIAIFLVGTLGGRVPSGLGGVASSLVADLQRWFAWGTLSPLQLGLTILIYQPLALAFAVVGSARVLRIAHFPGRFAFFWLISLLVIGLIIPGRQPLELVWVALPLWIIAGPEIARHFQIDIEDRLATLMQAGLIILLLFVTWLNLASLLTSGGDSRALILRWILVASILGIGLLATMLVSLGWSRQVALSGLVIGLAVSFGLLAAGESLSVGRLRPHHAYDLWQAGPVIRDADLLLATLEDLSEWRTGRRDSLDVTLLDSDAALQWALRRFPNLISTDLIGTDRLPSAIIAPEAQPEPALAIAYRGQVFDWEQRRAWTGTLPADWLRWLLFRASPVSSTQITLWVRSDVFPAGEVVMQSTNDAELPADDFFDEDSPLR